MTSDCPDRRVPPKSNFVIQAAREKVIEAAKAFAKPHHSLMLYVDLVNAVRELEALEEGKP
jgi:hypothetical protein